MPATPPFEADPMQAVAAAPLLREAFRVNVQSAVPFETKASAEIAFSLIAPLREASDPFKMPVVLVCCPGGFLSRRYYDLTKESPLARGDAGAEARPFSFAEAMARRGAIVLSFDPFGVGESSRPDRDEDAYSLRVEDLAAIHHAGVEAALARIKEGGYGSKLPPVSSPIVLGVGHSMGSALTVEHQSCKKAFSGLILFSFTTAGVPRFLTDAQRAVAHDPARARAEIGALTRASFGTPYPPRAADSEEGRVAAFGVGTAPPAAEEALHLAATSLLGSAGLLSMIPDGYAPAAALIDVPVLIVVGDHDLHDDTGLAGMLPNSPQVETFVLEDCWHCHFVANTRETLWQRVASWIHDHHEKRGGSAAA